MDTALNHQTILITGAAGRIGSAIARDLLDEGAKLILSDINESGLSQLQKELSSDLVYCVPANITSEASIKELLACSLRYSNRIDSVVHSAYPHSTTWGCTIDNLDESSLNEDLSMQLGSAILISKVFIKHFQESGGGNLIHVSSIQGVSAPKFDHYEGTQMHSPIEYAAIKAGVISITRWLAKYYANQNIRVNCISPGGIFDDQPHTFLNAYRKTCTNYGMLAPQQIAGSVSFLLSPNAAAINGHNLIIDDGWTL